MAGGMQRSFILHAPKTLDPNKHQAIQTRPAGEGYPPNTVAQVVQQGFMIHDRVLRPAAVIVAQ